MLILYSMLMKEDYHFGNIQDHNFAKALHARRREYRQKRLRPVNPIVQDYLWEIYVLLHVRYSHRLPAREAPVLFRQIIRIYHKNRPPQL